MLRCFWTLFLSGNACALSKKIIPECFVEIKSQEILKSQLNHQFFTNIPVKFRINLLQFKIFLKGLLVPPHFTQGVGLTMHSSKITSQMILRPTSSPQTILAEIYCLHLDLLLQPWCKILIPKTKSLLQQCNYCDIQNNIHTPPKECFLYCGIPNLYICSILPVIMPPGKPQDKSSPSGSGVGKFLKCS